ncbi:MAG: energy-dependent translational throttle protein EttA [Planctomycetes bacterium]|nr:energy-dependent translational throttle protein EttA [Planctomycetota bacterium]
MAEYVYVLRELNKSYDRQQVLRDITLAFVPGAKIGVIGHNGAGKSSLLRIMSGLDKQYEGFAQLAEGCTVGYVPQEPKLDPTLDVRGNLEQAVKPVRDLLHHWEQLNEKLATELTQGEMERVMEELSRVQDRIDARNAWELDRELDLAMHALNLPPGDADVTKLSGGEQRRVALCKVLMEQPDVLLLDEPTNHLDADTVAWLEQHLKEYPGCVILITHDRYFLDNVVGWMLELDRGRATPYEGNYSEYLRKRAERLRVEERADDGVRRMIERELEWIRQSPRARVAKNKARIRNYEQLEARESEVREGSIELVIPHGQRLGDRVITFNNVSKSYGDNQLVKDLSIDIPPGAVVGVIGKNGTGKTTVLRMIAGQEKPDEGGVSIGSTVDLCYVDQMRDTLDPANTVFQEITGGKDLMMIGKREVNSRAYVARFNFRGTDQQKLVGECSGGQRNRIQMAKLLRRGGNVLLLDEPTNDLDVETLRILEEALQEFPGCAVVVSHDRYFLNRLATHILAFEGDGKVRLFEGDYGAYVERLAEERGGKTDSSAAKYRKLKG